MFLLGIGLVVTLYGTIGVDRVASRLGGASLQPAGLALVAFVFAVLAWAIRWDVYIMRAGHRIPFVHVLSNVLIGMAVNNITPVAKFGGEPVRAYVLHRRNGVPIHTGFATITTELLMDFFVSMVLVVLAIAVAAFTFRLQSWVVTWMAIVVVLSVIGLAVFIGVISSHSLVSRLVDWIAGRSHSVHRHHHRILGHVTRFQKVFKESLKDHRATALAFATSSMQRMFDLLRIAFVLAAFDLRLSLASLLVLFGVNVLLNSIPSTPGGLGLVEGGTVSALVLMGVPIEIAGAAVLLERIISYWLPLAAGATLGLYYGVSLTRRPGTQL